MRTVHFLKRNRINEMTKESFVPLNIMRSVRVGNKPHNCLFYISVEVLLGARFSSLSNEKGN